MQTRGVFRLFLAMLNLGLVVLGAAVVYMRITRFEGLLIVEQDTAESWVVRPSREGGFFRTAHRNMPAEVIPFENPRVAARALGPRDLFDAVPLPFRVSVRDIEVLEQPTDHKVIEVVAGGIRRSVEAIAGTAFDTTEGAVRIHELGMWTGLLREGSGLPMAALSIETTGNDRVEGIFLHARVWECPVSQGCFLFRWHATEEEARATLPEVSPDLEAARWGVIDGDRTHWFESFEPGTGAITSDGKEYTLLEVRESSGVNGENGPAILVERKRGAEVSTHWISANHPTPSQELVFQHPGQVPVMIFIHAWRDGAVWMRGIVSGVPLEPARLEEGDRLELESAAGGIAAITLDQVMRTALPVAVENSPVHAVTLSFPDGRHLKLREGQALSRGDQRLIFRRIPQPPLTRYTLVMLPSGSEKDEKAFSLAPGTNKRYGGWRFYNDPDKGRADRVAVVRMKRVGATPFQYLGMIMFVCGAVGACWVRFRPMREEKQGVEPQWNEVTPDEQGDASGTLSTAHRN